MNHLPFGWERPPASFRAPEPGASSDQRVLFPPETLPAVRPTVRAADSGSLWYDSAIRHFWPSHYLGAEEIPLPRVLLTLFRIRDTIALVLLGGFVGILCVQAITGLW